MIVRAYINAIAVSAGSSTSYYTPAKFLNSSGVPYSTVSVNAAMNNFLLSIPNPLVSGGIESRKLFIAALTETVEYGTPDEFRNLAGV